MRLIQSTRLPLAIVIFSLIIFSQRLYAQDTGDWDNVRKILNQRVEVYYGTAESRFAIILKERIVGFDENYIYTACAGHTHEHNKKFIRTIAVKRKTFFRILSLFLLAKEEIIYSSAD